MEKNSIDFLNSIHSSEKAQIAAVFPTWKQ